MHLQVYRQDHPAFIATLAKIRRGICDDECIAFLKTCGTELGRGGNIKIQVRGRTHNSAYERVSDACSVRCAWCDPAAYEPLPYPERSRERESTRV